MRQETPENESPLADPAKLNQRAPETFRVRFDTTRGPFVVEVKRAWSPHGADRLYNLVKHGFFDGMKFFRVVPDFVVQFGIHGDPKIASKWQDATLRDERVVASNKRGFLTYAKASYPDSRTTQLFINLADNERLDAMGFAPFGRVVRGMEIVDKLYGGYGEALTELQDEIVAKGNAFLDEKFPRLDAIKKAVFVR